MGFHIMLKKALTTFFKKKRGLEHKYYFYDERGSKGMKIIYDNEDEEFDIATDIIQIRKGLETIVGGHCDDIGLYYPRALLKVSQRLESKLVNEDFYKKNRVSK